MFHATRQRSIVFVSMLDLVDLRKWGIIQCSNGMCQSSLSLAFSLFGRVFSILVTYCVEAVTEMSIFVYLIML